MIISTKTFTILLLLAAPCCAGPVEFGLGEFQRALAARGGAASRIRLRTEVNMDGPESFRIVPNLVTGGDLRGIMYGLLAAAEQIRLTGRLVAVRAEPAVALRGIRMSVPPSLLADQASVRERWRAYFAMLARNRFNRLHLSVPALPAGTQDLEMLRFLSQTALDHAVDFVLGVERPLDARPDDALKRVLAFCPAIRAVQLEAGPAFHVYQDRIFEAIRGAGRLVTLELHDAAEQTLKAAAQAGLSARLSLPYSSQPLGRPYQPPHTLGMPKRPLAAEIFWQLSADRPSLWGDPELVRRALPTFRISEAAGFEIDLPSPKDLAFESQWLFHLLWGRLGYDPKTPERVWQTELKNRFGSAAGETLALYRETSRVLSEIAEAGSPYHASPADAVANLLEGRADARRTPVETANRLLARALAIEQGLSRLVQQAQPDFQSVASLARHHAHRLLAADQTAYYHLSGDPETLRSAKDHLARSLSFSQDSPESVRREIQEIEQLEQVLAQFGRFDFGFDFGEDTARARDPHFRLVTADTDFAESRGFGWIGPGERTAADGLAEHPLFGDAIRGRGPQTFRVRTGEGEFAVFLVHPDRATTPRSLQARYGYLDVVLPETEWTVSGIVIKSAAPRKSFQPPPPPKNPKRPAITHTPPKSAVAGHPLALALRVTPPSAATRVRLHYRALDSRIGFKTLTAPAGKAGFAIPPEEIAPGWDLLYYFEILNDQKTGWFEPDPDDATPYYVISVEEPKASASSPAAPATSPATETPPPASPR